MKPNTPCSLTARHTAAASRKLRTRKPIAEKVPSPEEAQRGAVAELG
jgi:hypothetical protein